MHLLCALLLIACVVSTQAAIQTHEMSYRGADGTRMVGYFTYDDSKPGIRPGVIVVHEWQGFGGYAKHRARGLAEPGYSALVISTYGEGRHTEHPQDTMTLMQAAARDAGATKARFLIGLEPLKRQPQTDPGQIAVIGYCSGGKIIPDTAHQDPPLVGVASFHGTLGTTTPASEGSVRAKIPVGHGGANSSVSAKGLGALRQELNAAGANYRVAAQDGAKHGFTNPDADACEGYGLNIGYDRQADRCSWADLQAFLEGILGQS